MKTSTSSRTFNLVRSAFCRAALLIFTATLMTGCGRAMTGKYGNDMMQIEFKSGSVAYLSMGIEGVSRTTTEVKYEVKGDKITLINQAGNLILTLNKDGTLGGAPMEAMSGPLKKLGSQATQAAPSARQNQTAGSSQAANPDGCAANLKIIGVAFKTWALDHAGQYPFNVHSDKGGSMERCSRDGQGFDNGAAAHFAGMADELQRTKYLICPADKSAVVAADFKSLAAANVSYKMKSGANIDETRPREVLVSCPLHGHVLLCDGSVKRGDQ